MTSGLRRCGSTGSSSPGSAASTARAVPGTLPALLLVGKQLRHCEALVSVVLPAVQCVIKNGQINSRRRPFQRHLQFTRPDLVILVMNPHIGLMEWYAVVQAAEGRDVRLWHEEAGDAPHFRCVSPWNTQQQVANIEPLPQDGTYRLKGFTCTGQSQC